MSRFHECDDFESNYVYLWESRVERIIKGKRGQQKLREFIEALLALPKLRLIASAIAKPNGEVCAIGAVAKHRGIDLNRDTVKDVYDPGRRAWVEQEVGGGWEGSDVETASLGEELGFTRTLAWEIGFKNDVELPDQRWFVPERPVRLDVPVFTEPDPRERLYGYGHNARPKEEIIVYVPDYDRAHFEGVTPEERWQRMYDWACSKVRWNLPAVAA